MIHNVVDFRTVKVSDVMIPLPKIVSAPPETTVPQLLELSQRTGVDRVPIISADGAALGLVNIFDVLVDSASTQSLRHYTRRIVSAGENESAYRIIRRLRAARLTLAAVSNERDQLTGIVTVEDLVRRLVQSA